MSLLQSLVYDARYIIKLDADSCSIWPAFST